MSPRVSLLLIAACLIGGIVATSMLSPQPQTPSELFREANALLAEGEYEQAEQAAADAFKLDPSFGKAGLLAAECAARQKNFEGGLAYVARLSKAQKSSYLEGQLRAAQWHRDELYRLSDAETAFRNVLSIEPDNIEANRGLVDLLGTCARRHEAIPYILRLVKLGEARDHLIMLGRDLIISQEGYLAQCRSHSPDDINPLIGLAWQAGDRDDRDLAIRLLQEAIQLDPQSAAAFAALGEQLLSQNRFDDLDDWESVLPEQANQLPKTWQTRGRWAMAQGDPQGAIRCFLECSRLAPELKVPNVELARLLSETGEDELASKFANRILKLNELGSIQDRFTTSEDYLIELIDKYQELGRLWEAYGWCRLAANNHTQSQPIASRLRQLSEAVESIPYKQTVDEANLALAVDRQQFPLPNFQNAITRNGVSNESSGNAISFREDASTTGFDFHYFNGSESPRRRMFEFTGGGIGILDYDVDGFPDAFLTQGHQWPVSSQTNKFNDALYRNQSGKRFVEVAGPSGVIEAGFGQGIAIGDVNSDGFPDAYVANIGNNQMWLNNGDGTFSDVTESSHLEGDHWTTSCLLADLNGDGLADIYDVNYEQGEEIFERVCTDSDGNPRLCLPHEFDGEPDRVWVNAGDGRFLEVTDESLSIIPDGKGLGIVAFAQGESTGLNVVVANDTTPNYFFTNQSIEKKLRLEERGILSGLALNSDGKSEGSMGIAIADVNRDGTLDLHMTNFYRESNTIYLNRSEGFYSDETRLMQLTSPTLELLGFGTQFLDADLDGRLELFVANGHVDDLRTLGKPYRMRPQVFRWNRDAFTEETSQQLGKYFEKEWLGRAVAKVDWNRDGQVDLVVGHLFDRTELLTNTSVSVGESLSIRLFGSRSSRDAIGTTVELHTSDQILQQQVTADGGYQASNERRLVFGIDKLRDIGRIVVRWPSGLVQEFSDFDIAAELLLREDGSLLAAAKYVE